jgi:hypothetical protein
VRFPHIGCPPLQCKRAHSTMLNVSNAAPAIAQSHLQLPDAGV